jgi:Cof subfamily protein (haloacid dehalogenase superfamily)
VTKVIATDLDGTLLHDDSTLSDRTRRALRLARASGARVVAATGRPARIIDLLFASEAEPLLDAAICGNGASSYDLAAKRIDVRKPIPADLARFLLERIPALLPGAGFAVETGHQALYEPGYRFRPSLDVDRVRVAAAADLLVGPLVKMMVFVPEGGPDAAWDLLRPELGEHIECSWSAPNAPLEICLAGVSKADALATVCREWGADATDVTAFGDSINDLPMLAWAGTTYAVANADPRVLALATHRTAANNDDGVAQVLERMFATTGA